MDNKLFLDQQLDHDNREERRAQLDTSIHAAEATERAEGAGNALDTRARMRETRSSATGDRLPHQGTSLPPRGAEVIASYSSVGPDRSMYADPQQRARQRPKAVCPSD